MWLGTHIPLERGRSKHYQKQNQKVWESLRSLGGSLHQNCLWDVGLSKTGWSLTAKASEESHMLSGDCCLLLVSRAKHSWRNEPSTSQSLVLKGLVLSDFHALNIVHFHVLCKKRTTYNPATLKSAASTQWSLLLLHRQYPTDFAPRNMTKESEASNTYQGIKARETKRASEEERCR